MSVNNGKDKLDLLPTLKGAPMSILYALHFFQRPMSNHKLIGITRYTDKTISAGLEILREKGLIRRTPGGWILSNGFFEIGNIPTSESELFHPHGNSSSTTTDINTVNKLDELVVVDNRKLSAYQALHNAGIYDPKASDLAELKHVTKEFVIAHAEYGKREKQGIGLVITRIQNDEPVPNKNVASLISTRNTKEPLRGKAVEDIVSEFLKP